MTIVPLIYFTCTVFALTVNAALFGSKSYPSDIMEDSELDTDQLIRKYNYPSETHYITTDDGYILRIHRIPNPNGKPILIQHGLMDSSGSYVLMGPDHGLAYYLHDKGYDVWLGNARGNRYSRNHTNLNPDTDSIFWNFSWHEIATHDIPAMIDYILQATNSQKLYYIGHSQGTTVLFVMCSMRPEYNDKIILAQALAPVAFMKHIRTPLLPLAESNLLVSTKSKLAYAPKTDKLKKLCLGGGRPMEDICINTFMLIMGKDMEQFNRTKFPVILGHVPAGAAVKQVQHYKQLIKSDQFCQFDYEQDNQKMYGQDKPPKYDLSKVTVRIALHYGQNDYLAEPVDILRLSDMLPNKAEVNKMKLPQWNHMDFLYAKDARKLLYEHVGELINKYQ